MPTPWGERALEPISEEAPCGVNLEETGDLAVLESYQIFGQDSLDPPERDPDAPVVAAKREPRKSDRPPNWRELEEVAMASLGKSKDLRALAHLAASRLRTADVPAFLETITVASQWLETFWEPVYPRVDDDPIFRTSALSSFADRAAIIDGLRRAPLVNGPLGRFSFRDLDGAGAAEGDNGRTGPDAGAVSGAFAAMPIDELRALHAGVTGGSETLRTIEQTISSQAGSDAVPAFELLMTQLQAMQTELRARLANHPDAVAGVDDGLGESAEAGAAKGAIGAIASRQDAIRALDAVADFFRRSEPSSPVPMIVERAKRLVSKSFLEVLADLAPGGLTEARSAGGIRDQMSDQVSE